MRNVIFIMVLMMLSCAEPANEEILEPEAPPEEQSPAAVDSTFSECDEFIAEHMGIGTACCISGFVVAAPGDTATYQYHINHPDAAVSAWVILEGNLSIYTINNPCTVTVIMGANFTGGILQAQASGAYDAQTRLICNDRIVIVPK